MTVPEVMAIDIATFTSISATVSAMVVQIQGEIADGGISLSTAPNDHPAYKPDARDDRYRREINEMDQSAAIEIGNIMISAFLDATAELLGIIMLPSPPALAIDMAHAAFESIVAQVATDVNDVLIFNTELTSEAPPVYGSIYMLPNVELAGQLFRMLERLMEPLS